MPRVSSVVPFLAASVSLCPLVRAQPPATSAPPTAAVPHFERQVIDAKIAIGYGVAIADVDGDGKPNVLLADKTQFVWYRNGDWKKFVLAENLTPQDDVCIAALGAGGGGKSEIAVGGNWNPGDTLKSGSVHYLVRPADPTQKWEAVELPHEPTVHRMAWVRSGEKAGRATHNLVIYWNRAAR